MNSLNPTQSDLPAKLSTLWIFLMFNMVFADIFSFMYPGAMANIVAGVPTDGIVITPLFLLLAAVINEIPIAMVLLPRFLKPGVSRWVNIAAALVTIPYVLGLGSLDYPHYIFIAAIEVLTSLVIVAMAWKWRVAKA